VSPRCEHGNYVDSCAECTLSNLEAEGQEAPHAKVEVFVQGFWDSGAHYELCVSGHTVEIHHLTEGGVRLPLAVLRDMVDVMKAEGVWQP
jgi:hypothetical protein